MHMEKNKLSRWKYPLILLVAVACLQSFVIWEVNRQVLEPANKTNGSVSVNREMVRSQESLLLSGAEAFDRNWFNRHGVVKIANPPADLNYWVYSPAGLSAPSGKEEREYVATVFLICGWGGSALSSHYLFPLATEMTKAGYKVIMLDLRGQGFSTGETVSYGQIDTADFGFLLSELRLRDEISGPVIVVGHSYGAAAAIQIAAGNPSVKAAVALSGQCELLSLGPTVRGLLRLTNPGLYWGSRPFLSDWAVRAGIRLAALRHGLDADKSSPLKAIGTTKAPVLVVHGEDDACVPVEHATRIHAGRPEGTDLMILAKHDHWSYLGSPEVVKAIILWLPCGVGRQR
jgi:hypothetical protein